MKLYKLINRKRFLIFFKCLVSVFLLAYVFFIPTKIMPKLLKQQELAGQDLKLDYNGVLELWNIDTFEGGSVSRTSWLEKRCLEFEKQNKGCFIIVSNMSPSTAINNINNGKIPNIISYGFGFGHNIENYLNEYTGNINVRDDLLKGCYKNNKLLAVPYILGGYVIASKSEINNSLDNIGFGQKNLNNFALSLALNNYKVSSIFSNNNLQDSFDAYDSFLNGKFNTLCGTQRDAYRLNNKKNNGSLIDLNIKYLSNFTDLIQCVSIAKCNKQEAEISKKFIEFLTSKDVQKTLKNISMFSVLPQSIYNSQDGYLFDMEKSLLQKLKTISVFIGESEIELLHKNALDFVLNKVKNLNEIKKCILD